MHFMLVCSDKTGMGRRMLDHVAFYAIFVGCLLTSRTTVVSGGVVQPVEFRWTSGEMNYSSNGQRLTGSVTATYDNAYLVTQCAFRCLQTTPDQCSSYNFLPTQRKCELNSASHVTSPGNLRPAADSQYYLRNAFSIDQVNNKGLDRNRFSNKHMNATILYFNLPSRSPSSLKINSFCLRWKFFIEILRSGLMAAGNNGSVLS